MKATSRFLGVVALSCYAVFGCILLLRAQQSNTSQGNMLTGSREVKVGDKGFIAWRFQGYESVKITGDTLNLIRGARDMITIAPTKTSVYNITALGQKGMRFDTVWRVVVLTEIESDSLSRLEAAQQSLTTGATSDKVISSSDTASSISPSVYLVAQANATPSLYYSGIRRSSKLSDASMTVKIVRIPNNNIENSIIHAVVLDKFGNFLPSLGLQKTAFSCSLLGLPDTVSAEDSNKLSSKHSTVLSADPPFTIRETSLYDSRDVALTICVDNASYMHKFPFVAGESQDFMQSLGGRVEQHTLLFDHRIVLKESPSQPAKDEGGLTALYKAAYKGILILKQSGRRHKALILLSGGKDDASLLYTMHDVMRSAREFGVVIYSIAIGSNADTYTLRNLADYSGGRFYAAEEGKPEELRQILKEISLSYKAFYEIAFTAGTNVQAHSKVIDATLSFKTSDGRTLSDTKPFAQNEQAYYSAHQIVATFAPNSFQPDEQFDSQISSLAQALKDNPTKIIELIGHTDMQGNDGINRSFALKRAQSVKIRLTAMGVNPAQIRLRSVGREKPVYYFENEEWQSRANRRVELRWLDPALVPFEILAEAVASEEEAMRLETVWSARGYDAYYDSFLVNRIPAYRLKLWGFPTLESAVKTKDELQAKYRLPLRVE